MKRWRTALWSAGAFAALAVVDLGLLDGFDLMVCDWARFHDVWGAAQLRADLILKSLRSAAVGVLLATFTLAYGAKRRSLRSAAFVASVYVTTVVLTVATKIIVGRLAAHAGIGPDGGSFLSGHVLGVVISLGVVVLMVQPRTQRRRWLIPAFGAVMGAGLLLQATRWSTNIGGGVLATAVLAAASGWIARMPHRSENDHESATARQRNVAWLTSVGQDSTWIARLNNLAPDSACTRCYDPGRGTFVLRSCGGL